ncbi:uncharacterized protein si:dkey-246e1.3 [Osmerus eperlanus]|uniref:uncharacterized protein si:dkey-246e1.3 n=1 Tax=Osmerus eperlanus TaxID=29151 RepID=UPI002E14E461
MSWDNRHDSTSVGFDRNTTAVPGTVDHGMSAARHELKVFNITMATLALCVLALTALYCGVTCHQRRRQTKRAHVYERAVRSVDPLHPVDVRAVKRSASFRNPLALFRKQEVPKDNSRIYYIYSNPLPVGVEESSATSGLEERDPLPMRELTMEDYAMDPSSGVIMDPPNFYMQL